MFVRFRQTQRRLQASLVETKRVDGRVRHEHIASLGSVDVPPSVRGRLTFWARLHGRLNRLGNRMSHEAHAKILDAIHARIPMVTPNEQRALQMENAKADEKFWSFLKESSSEQIEGNKGLIASAEQSIAARQAAVSEADAELKVIKARKERMERGEPVSGGFAEPRDFEQELRDAGFTAAQLKYFRLLATIPRGPALDALMKDIHRRKDAAERAAVRAAAKRLKVI